MNDFDELDRRSGEVTGKIVVFNQKWINYDSSVQYRSQGCERAAKYGAVAALVRSVTPFSLESVHTGC